MPPTPSFASLQYGVPYTIWQAIIKHTDERIRSLKCSQESVKSVQGLVKFFAAFTKLLFFMLNRFIWLEVNY